jgi:DeoR/GlpR family transcriptional regulator of sugar metabolism
MATKRATGIDLKSRRDLFLSHLNAHKGQQIPIVSFVELTKTNQPEYKDITPRACKDLLEKMKRSIAKTGAVLTVGKDYAVLQDGNPTVMEERAKLFKDIKIGLGKVLWRLLFNLGSIAYSCDFTESLLKKLSALDRKSLITCLIDSGSTTRAVLDPLLATNRMPFRVEHPDKNHHLVSLRVITNCPSILIDVYKSKHGRLIELISVGGAVRVERESSCGILTEMALQAWSITGDVAVVGTTGYRGGQFACDDIEEARLKIKFLEMATGLRVIVFDSSKLRSSDLLKTFATLSPAIVDLIVTDDGGGSNCQSEVEDLRNEASAAKVAMAVLNTTDGGKHSEPRAIWRTSQPPPLANRINEDVRRLPLSDIRNLDKLLHQLIENAAKVKSPEIANSEDGNDR